MKAEEREVYGRSRGGGKVKAALREVIPRPTISMMEVEAD